MQATTITPPTGLLALPDEILLLLVSKHIHCYRYWTLLRLSSRRLWHLLGDFHTVLGAVFRVDGAPGTYDDYVRTLRRKLAESPQGSITNGHICSSACASAHHNKRHPLYLSSITDSRYSFTLTGDDVLFELKRMDRDYWVDRMHSQRFVNTDKILAIGRHLYELRLQHRATYVLGVTVPKCSVEECFGLIYDHLPGLYGAIKVLVPLSVVCSPGGLGPHPL